MHLELTDFLALGNPSNRFIPSDLDEINMFFADIEHNLFPFDHIPFQELEDQQRVVEPEQSHLPADPSVLPVLDQQLNKSFTNEDPSESYRQDSRTSLHMRNSRSSPFSSPDVSISAGAPALSSASNDGNSRVMDADTGIEAMGASIFDIDDGKGKRTTGTGPTRTAKRSAVRKSQSRQQPSMSTSRKVRFGTSAEAESCS